MSLFNREGGIMDVIRCDEPDYLIWKWRPEGTSGKTKRENSIRWGSNLSVKEGSLAVFVYKGKQDYILGPYSGTIKTANLPVIASLISLGYAGNSPFPAEVYFINLADIIQINYAIPYFDVFDSVYTEFSVPVAVRGTITFRIEDYQRFINLHRLDEFDLGRFKSQINDAVCKYVKGDIANAPTTYGIPVIQIERAIPQLDNTIGTSIKNRLYEDFGVAVIENDIGAIDVDTTSDGYNELISVTREITAATIQAQAVANIKNIEDMQRINAHNYEETLRIQREEDQYARHLDTQTKNIGAHTINRQAEVGIAGAEGIGNMRGGIGGGDGLNPAGLMAGMAIGSAFGQNIAGNINNVMSNSNPNQPVPPPIPNAGYFVANNGQSTGPFDINALRQMILVGTLKRDSLIWKAGMANWVRADSITELSDLFATPPAPPVNNGRR